MLAGGGEWFHVGRGRDRSWAVVRTVMNLQVLEPRNKLLSVRK
jgi:hypothetical protein